jgi:hypothetical protein
MKHGATDPAYSLSKCRIGLSKAEQSRRPHPPVHTTARGRKLYARFCGLRYSSIFFVLGCLGLYVMK